jgi:hypothetical protein
MIPSAWLTELLDRDAVAEIALALESDPCDKPESVLDRDAAAALRPVAAAGDELWAYCSPLDTWQRGTGESGVAVVRQGQPVAAVATYRSRHGPGSGQ